MCRVLVRQLGQPALSARVAEDDRGRAGARRPASVVDAMPRCRRWATPSSPASPASVPRPWRSPGSMAVLDGGRLADAADPGRARRSRRPPRSRRSCGGSRCWRGWTRPCSCIPWCAGPSYETLLGNRARRGAQPPPPGACARPGRRRRPSRLISRRCAPRASTTSPPPSGKRPTTPCGTPRRRRRSAGSSVRSRRPRPSLRAPCCCTSWEVSSSPSAPRRRSRT